MLSAIPAAVAGLYAALSVEWPLSRLVSVSACRSTRFARHLACCLRTERQIVQIGPCCRGAGAVA